MRPHVGNYLHLQWNKKIVQLRYKDSSTCIHLTTIKTFWELQMESKYLTPDQLTMKFYWNFISLVFTLILSWLSYLREVCVVHADSHFWSFIKCLLIYNICTCESHSSWSTLFFSCSDVRLSLESCLMTGNKSPPSENPHRHQKLYIEQREKNLKGLVRRN